MGFVIWDYLLTVDAAFGGWDFALGIGMEILLLLILLQKIAMESPTHRGNAQKNSVLTTNCNFPKNEVCYRIILRAL